MRKGSGEKYNHDGNVKIQHIRASTVCIGSGTGLRYERIQESIKMALRYQAARTSLSRPYIQPISQPYESTVRYSTWVPTRRMLEPAVVQRTHWFRLRGKPIGFTLLHAMSLHDEIQWIHLAICKFAMSLHDGLLDGASDSARILTSNVKCHKQIKLFLFGNRIRRNCGSWQQSLNSTRA